MPIWLYIPVVIGAQVLGVIGIAAGAAWVVARLLGLNGFGAKGAVFLGLCLCAVQACMAVLLIGFDGALALPVAMMVTAIWFVLPLFLFKLIGRCGWGRAAGAWVLFIPLFAAVGFGVGLLLRRSVADPYRVPTKAMAPTIIAGDRVLVDRTCHFQRWDIIAFRAPHEPGQVYMKRLVGLPGETVEIVNGEIRVNGAVIRKPPEIQSIAYSSVPRGPQGLCRGCEGRPMTLGPGEHFVLGDNTEESLDSRYWPAPVDAGVQAGAVPGGAIVGTARVLDGPFGRMRVFR